MPLITIGADPELFLMDLNGRMISAIDRVGGTKKKPRPIGMDCSVQEDGMAVEFGFVPAKTSEEFIKRCNYALEYLTNYAAEQELFLNIKASVHFDDEQLKHPKALISGCDPDYNVWTGKENPRVPLEGLTQRVAGGHIHIGVPNGDIDRILLAKWCDLALGVPAVLEDEDTERKKLYGKAGAYRPKPYGVEYRSLSNYWLKDEKLMAKVFERATEAVNRVGFNWGIDDDADRIQRAINTNDKGLAEELMAEYGVA